MYWIVDGTSQGSFVNLAYGEISGNTITGIWVDLPGSPSLGGGNLTLRIESNDRFVKVSESSYYGAQEWTRVGSSAGSGPVSGATDDIAGSWDSNGNIYEITRTATGFAWYLQRLDERATITVDALNISASWRGSNGSGSATGTIELTSGKPTLIKWNNGALFKRVGTTGLGQQRALAPANIAGRWRNQDGAVYEIEQAGEECTWLVRTIGQTAKCRVDGDQVTAQWYAAGDTTTPRGNATGIVKRDANGTVQRIEWSNGVVFTR